MKMQTDQFSELAAAIMRSLPRNLSTTEAQFWIANQNALGSALASCLSLEADERDSAAYKARGVAPAEEFELRKLIALCQFEKVDYTAISALRFPERDEPNDPSVVELVEFGTLIPGSFEQVGHNGPRIEQIESWLSEKHLRRASLRETLRKIAQTPARTIRSRDKIIVMGIGGRNVEARTSYVEVFVISNKARELSLVQRHLGGYDIVKRDELLAVVNL
ncbi:MAG: hypothetical protein V1821_04445 [bacterium]